MQNAKCKIKWEAPLPNNNKSFAMHLLCREAFMKLVNINGQKE